MKQNSMNPEAKKLFLAEIKSRIPEVGAVTVNFGKLKSGANLSLDGMICEAYLKANSLSWDGFRNECCHGQSHMMPKQVRDWAGLTRCDPYIEVQVAGTKDGDFRTISTTLGVFNDRYTPNITAELLAEMDANF